MPRACFSCVFIFYDTATTEIYTLSLHDALPIFFARDLNRLVSGTIALECAELEIIGDGHCAEELAPLRHQTKAQRDSLLDADARDWRTGIAHLAARWQQAHDGAEQRRLAGAVGS